MKPYIDLEVTDSYIIREFGDNIDPIELLWHRDNEDRLVEVLQAGNGWQFQMEDQIPQSLIPGVSIFIYRHDWHRVIKGEDTLIIKINKK